MSPPETTLRVRRPSGHYQDALASYRLELDGQTLARIRPGQDLTFAIPPGTHSLRARINWTGSRTLAFDAAPGSTVTVRVQPVDVMFGLWRMFTTTEWVMIELMEPGHESQDHV